MLREWLYAQLGFRSSMEIQKVKMDFYVWYLEDLSSIKESIVLIGTSHLIA